MGEPLSEMLRALRKTLSVMREIDPLLPCITLNRVNTVAAVKQLV
jgi:hypothetical protein